MVSAPSTPFRQASQAAKEFAVLLGPEDGSAPTLENEVDWLVPHRVSLTAGGSRDDVLGFTVDLAKAGKRLQDTTTPTAIKRQIELRTLDEDGAATIVLGWGFLSKNPQQINSDNETTSYEARIARHHYGTALTSYSVWDAASVDLRTIHRPLVFNPSIDEIVEPNMGSYTHAYTSGDATIDVHFPLDPESMRTTASQTFQQQTRSSWKLSDAVLFLCWWLNPSQTYIQNPIAADLQNAFSSRDTMLKNVEIPFGAWLPDALDQLLQPFEYGWHLVHKLDGSGNRKTTIRFFPRGQGVMKRVHLQRVGETRDIRESNVAEFEAEYDINQLANRIEVYGDFLKREATFELQKGWSTAYDSTNIEDLEKGQANYESHPSVGRKWILNEAGDYNNLRTEITTPYDLSGLFGSSVQAVRRRRFTRCLSQHADADDRESNGFRVDWYDADAEGATDPDVATDPGWTRVKWPFSVLEKECGILFEGNLPPEELWSLIADGTPANARVRITATVVGDQRVKGIATRRDRSPNGQDVTLVLDLHDRFQFSAVDSSSIFHARPSIARDDSTVIQTYAESVRDIEDAMKIHCSLTLEGVNHPEYEIGDLIENVMGRNLSLNGYNPSGGSSPRNPQIVGFVWHLSDGQRLELMLDSFERERPQIVTDNHQRVLA
jgi:hypothetical protein